MTTIRPAVPSDIDLIVALIRELADYERLLNEVKATRPMLRDALFGPTPRVFCDIAEFEGAAVGFVLWYYSFSSFEGRHGIYLEDLIVLEPYRGKGIGKALLKHLARRCVEGDLARLEWSVLDWNIRSIEFYRSQGAVLLGDWTKARISDAALFSLAKQTG